MEQKGRKKGKTKRETLFPPSQSLLIPSEWQWELNKISLFDIPGYISQRQTRSLVI